MNELRTAALSYAKQGYAVFPLSGKDPLNRHGFKGAQTREMALYQWWRHHHGANVGIAVPEGVVVVDVDPRHGGTLDMLGTLPDTPTARTGGGGWHVWFKAAGVKQGAPAGGIDTRVGGSGYVVAPPSVHPDTSVAYEWLPGLALGQVDVADMPQQVYALLESRGLLDVPTRAYRNGASAPQTVGSTSSPGFWVQRAVSMAEVGKRHDVGLWLAIQLRANCFPHDMAGAEPHMLDYQASVPQPDGNEYNLAQALATLRGVYSSDSYLLPPAQSTAVLSEAKGSEAKPRQGNELTQIGRGEGVPLPGEEEDWQLNDIQDAKNPALAEEYRSWFLKGRQADAFPADGLVQYPGSNAQRRNASQRYVLRKAHNLLFPDAELLSDVELSKLLNLVRQEVGVGRECAIVLDKLWHARDGHYRATQATIKTPRAWLLSVVRRGLLPPPEKAVAEPAAEGTHPDEADYQEFRVNKGAADLFGLSVEEVA